MYEETQKRKEEKKKEKKKRRHRDTNVDAFSAATDRNNDVLDRVKRNQERLQLARQEKDGNSSSAQGNKKSDMEEEEVEVNEIDLPQMTLDFYDEDDEGFEVDPDEKEFYNLGGSKWIHTVSVNESGKDKDFIARLVNCNLSSKKFN